MNHVPDETLDAIDAFGSGLLKGTAPPVDSRLRQDLRVQIQQIDETTALCRYETTHTQAP